ncbi:Uncharacterised protein [Mycobacteroides abscessus subsp. abscessus]|nr:Uncharacterised protein [Mycobacteroides abscessus subsp. abscessus]
MEPSASLSIDTLAANADPAMILMIGGISRLSAARLVSGLTVMSLNDADNVLKSAMTLRPLVSVPAIDGNLESCLVTRPTWSAKSAM